MKYKEIRKLYKTEIKKAKIEYNNKLIHLSSNKNMAAWKLIRGESNSSNKVSDTSLTADDFNQFFVSVGINQRKTPNITSNNGLENIMEAIVVNKQAFWFENMSPASIVLAVKKMKSSFSEDTYGMSSYIIKHIIDLILYPLCDLINDSLNSGFFPSILKHTIIVPIFKSGDRNDPGKYRPIALIPILSKVIEHVVLDQFRVYFDKYIDNSQYGFRPGLGTSNAIDRVLRIIHTNLNSHRNTSTLFLDLSKAFDSLSHQLLLSKLKLYGIRDNSYDFIKSYLSDRHQVVKLRDKFSKQLITNCGVPQGSVLGPFLFLLFMNDFPTYIQIPTVIYADDTTLMISDSNINDLNDKTQEILAKASLWFDANELMLNTDKTTNILFSTNKEIRKLNSNNQTKLLGVYLNDDLSWNSHIDSLLKTLSKSLYILRKLKTLLSMKYLCLSYHAYFHSHISFSILFWGGVPRLNEVFILQKRAIRIICGLLKRESCRGHFKRLNILTVPSTYVLNSVLYVKKHLKSFKLRDEIHSYNTRGKKKIDKPKLRLELIRRSYVNQGIELFNLLPKSIQDLTYIRFRRTLKELLIQGEAYSTQEIHNLILGLNNDSYSI